MAEVDVKKQQYTETGGEQKSLAKRESRGLSRRRGWDPFSFSLFPSDFFGTDPFSFMRRLHEEMDRRMPRFFGGESGGSFRTWSPAIEVAERNGQLQVHAELPGLKPEDVKVEVTDDSLIIQGERKWEQKEREGKGYRTERRYGQFYRALALPDGAKFDQIKADFQNGELKVTVPLEPQKSKRRQVPVSSSSSSLPLNPGL